MANFSTIQVINAGRSRTIGGADSLLVLQDVLVTAGKGLKSAAATTSDDIAITLADNGGLSTFQIKDLGTNNVMVVDSDGNVDISGNLNVTGSIVSRDEERVLVADNFLDINFGHVSTTALSGGIAVNYVSTAAGTNKSIDTGSNTITFTAVAGVARPKLVAATGSAIPANTYVTNDIVQISGTLSAENDGFYVVSTNAVAGTIEFLSTVKTTPDTINFKPAQVNFTGEANTSGTVTISKVKVTVLQVNVSNGTWETATGDIDGDFSSPGDLGGSTLQEAYDLGATILTDASGPIIFNLAADAQGLAINGSSAGNGIVSIGGTTAVDSIVMNASGAASSITATTQTLSLATTGNNELDITSGGALDLNGVAVTVDGTGGVALAGEGAASSFTSASQNLTLSTTTAGTLAVSSAAALAVSGADDSTINITGTTKTLDVDATGAVSVNSSGGIINIGDDAVAQAINIGTGAAARTITVGANASTKVVVNAQSAADGIALQVAGVSKLMVNGVDSTIESQYSLLFPTIGTAVAPSAASALLLANASGLQLDKGKIVALNASGQLQLADANGGNPGDSVRCPVGAPLANIGDGAAGAVGIGGMVPVFCADASHATNANRGKPVYLTDAGAVSTIAPASSGDTVFQVGILQAQATGTPLLAYVLWQPMFVADIT